MSIDSLGSRARLSVGAASYDIFRLDAAVAEPGRLPYSLRVLLENLLRREDGANVTADDIAALADRSRAATEAGSRELQFMPASRWLGELAFRGAKPALGMAAIAAVALGTIIAWPAYMVSRARLAWSRT